MGPQHLPHLLVTTFTDQVNVDLSEGRQVSIWIFGGYRPVGVGNFEMVIRHFGERQHADPDPAMLVGQGILVVAHNNGHTGGHRA